MTSEPQLLQAVRLAVVPGARLAPRALGWTESTGENVTIAQPEPTEAVQHLYAKDMQPSAVVALARVMLPREQEAARGRQIAAHASPAKLAGLGEQGEAIAVVAKQLGTSKGSLQKAMEVVKEAEGSPLYADLIERMDEVSIDSAYGELKRRKIVAASIASPPPDGLYRTIVCDPPWPMTGVPYPTMSVERIIADTPIPATPDCHLWLWTIDTYLHDAMHVMEAWGFDRKSTLVWVKPPPFGLGGDLREQAEFCLHGVRGDARALVHDVSSVLIASRGAHSEKPQEFYDHVERLCPGPYIDIYARKPREGWSVWGNQVGSIA